MDLPNEIILHILKSLKKCDLKSARLVSRNWTPFASELLFDQIYVSVHPDNLSVFEYITRNAQLSKYVKTLRYDAIDFIDNYTIKDYSLDLFSQTRGYVRHYPPPVLFDVPDSDPEIIRWINLVVKNRALFLWRTSKDYKFVSHGYHKYQRYAALQRTQSNSGEFVEILVRGLQMLTNLSCVIVDDQWPFPQQVLDDRKKLFLTRPGGSPLARKWNMFHACPQSWKWMPEDYHPDVNREAQDGAGHYWAITCALIRSQRKIETLEVGRKSSNGIPAYVFDRSKVRSISFHGLDIVAFSGLKKLSLSIAAYGDEKTSEFFPNMEGLRFLLGSMHHLEALSLELPGDPVDKPTLYTYDQVFPQEGQWKQLTTLSLHHFASSAADFLTLLTSRMPHLSELQLGTVELLTGTWEGVIECMMLSMHLLRFDIFYDTQLWHHGGTEFFSQQSIGPCEIEEYVQDGGHHPCLRSGQPDSAAQNYVTEDFECFCNRTPRHCDY